MGQYILHPEKDFENLEMAIKNYPLHSILISPFSLGNRKEVLYKDLEKSILNFSVENELTLYVDNKEFFKFNLDKNHCFKIEYQDKKKMRLWIPNYHPDEPNLPTPIYSALRNVIDDLLLEIWFKGKIKIEPETSNFQYWKIVPPQSIKI